MHPEKVREIVREEIEKRLQKDPIPGPSFEGGSGMKWEPKKGDSVQVLRDVAFLKKNEVATVAAVTIDKGIGFAFFSEGALLGWAPFSDLAPVKVIGYDPKLIAPPNP